MLLVHSLVSYLALNVIIIMEDLLLLITSLAKIFVMILKVLVILIYLQVVNTTQLVSAVLNQPVQTSKHL